jgi:hypothetical protein
MNCSTFLSFLTGACLVIGVVFDAWWRSRLSDIGMCCSIVLVLFVVIFGMAGVVVYSPVDEEEWCRSRIKFYTERLEAFHAQEAIKLKTQRVDNDVEISRLKAAQLRITDLLKEKVPAERQRSS